MNALGHEIVFALRQMAWRPGFAFAMVITLALGIGATTAIFSVLHAVILSPLPYKEPERLVSVWESAPERDVRRNVVNSGNYLDWRDENEVFDSIGAYSHVQLVALAGGGHPEYLTAITATPSLFETLGVHPVLGGLPTERNEVLISHGFWQSRFGADPEAIGALVRLDEAPVTVTGVMPPGFQFPTDEIQVWRALTFADDAREARRGRQWKVVARLKPGMTVEQAQFQMRIVADSIRERHPALMDGWSVNVYPLQADVVAGHTERVSAEGGVADMLWVVMWVVALTLLIACVNAAGLLLARLVRRRHELAVRRALGAGNRRLVLGVFSECAVYTVIGAAAGIVLAYWLLAVLTAAAPSEIPRLAEASINAQVLAFGCLLAFMAIGMVGLVPALAATREDAAAALAGGARTGGAGRTNWRRGLIATEVALACVLTAGALLLTHNLIRLLNVDPGHEVAGIQVVSIPLSAQRIGETDAQVRFHEQVMDRLRAQPGVIAVSGTAEPPLVGHQMTFSYFVEGAPEELEDAQAVRVVHPDYFRTLGLAMHAGRGFTPDDRANGALVAVVNEAFARRTWPGESAIGKRIAVDERGGPWIEVVGVAADTRHDGLMRESVPAIYLPFAQKPWWWMSWTSYVVRLAPGTTLAEDIVREAVWAVDPDVAVGAVQSLESIFAASTARARLTTALLGGFGILALILSAVGIYSVVAFSVAQREREFGVRMAMGANRGSILRYVVGWGLTMAVVGVGAGLLLALAFARALASQLYMISPFDPVAFSLMPALIVGIAVLACLVPGLRAARLDPMVALREE